VAVLNLGAVRSAALRRAPIDDRIVIRGDRCERSGQVSAVLATSDLDIDALDAARKAAAGAAFARMCHTLERPMQLLIRVRRLTESDVSASQGQHARLDEAMRRYWADQIRDGERHTRRVFVILSAQTPAALDSVCAQACDRLGALGVRAHRVDGDALLAAITDGVDANDATTWSEHREHAAVGDQMVCGHALQRLPGHPVSPGWLAPLLGVQAEADIAIHLEPAPLGDALGRLNRRLRDFTAHRMLEVERGALGDVHVDIGLDAATALRERLARNLGRPLHLAVIATARAHSIDELQARSDALRLGFASALIGVEVTHFRHLAAHVSTLPLGINALRSSKLVDSTAAATCIPWIEAGCSDPDGYRLGAATRSGLPVRVAPFDTSRHPNPNIAVFAASATERASPSGRSCSRPRSRVCAISLRDMPPEHVAAATLIVARWLWELVRRDRRRRHIVFDEVGALCVHRPLRDLLVQLARRCRKYSASLVVATQNAQDLLGTDEGSVIATNCAVVLLGGHRAAETARMEHAFGLTEAQRSFLETAARGEFLLLAGDRRVAMRIEVPELHRSILTEGTGTAYPLDASALDSQDMGAPGRLSPKIWDH